MTESLTFLVQELGRAIALVWGGIGIAVKLNYEVMSVVVTITSRIVQLLFLLTQKTVQVCNILASDLLLFMGDVGSGVIALFTTLQNLGKGLIGAVVALVTSAYAAFVHIYELVGSFKSSIVNLFIYTISHAAYALNLVKHGFILFGSSVIFAISFLPKLIFLLVTSTFKLIINAYLQSYLFVQNSLLSSRQVISNFGTSVTEYFTDIPVNAVIGFCLGVIFLVALNYFLHYLIANFTFIPDINLSSIGNSVKRRIIQWFIRIRQRNTLVEQYDNTENEDEASEYNADAGPSTQNGTLRQPEMVDGSGSSFGNHITEETNNHIDHPSLARRPITRRHRTFGLAADVTDEDVTLNKSPTKIKKNNIYPSSNSNLTWAKDLYKELQDEREGKLCIICQDKVKRVILLPCRHLCLCDACRSAVIMRDNTCPICRKPILDSIRVFL